MTLSSQSEHSRACTDSPHYSQPFLAGSWSIQTAPEGAVLLPALLCAPSSLRSLEHKHVLLMRRPRESEAFEKDNNKHYHNKRHKNLRTKKKWGRKWRGERGGNLPSYSWRPCIFIRK